MVIAVYVLGLLWILWNSKQLPKLTAGSVKLQPVTLCVPLRNEQHRVGALIHNLKQLRYDNVEILLYDDESSDETINKIRSAIEGDVRFKLIEGGPLPVGWKGKPHACYQLGKHATGDIILFIDADVSLYRTTICAVVQTFQTFKCDAMSGFPKFINSSWLEKLLTPMLHFFIYMHLPIKIANNQRVASASAASGAFVAMTKKCFEETNGHALVKNEVVEDVALFRQLKRKGYKAILFNITDYVSCTMYQSSKEAWQGFLKNSFAGFNYNVFLGTAVIIGYLIYFVSPLFIVVEAMLEAKWLYVWPYILVTLQRFVSDIHSKSVNIYTLFMPISALVYVLLLVHAIARYTLKRNTKWKGRSV